MLGGSTSDARRAAWAATRQAAEHQVLSERRSQKSPAQYGQRAILRLGFTTDPQLLEPQEEGAPGAIRV